MYLLDIKTYKKIIKESITTNYKLADDNTINRVNDEVARILAARNEKKIPKYVTDEAFITLKNRKQTSPTPSNAEQSTLQNHTSTNGVR